jgi:aquaporin Z
VIALEALFAGPICGASMNPARSLAPALVASADAARQVLWIYIAAPILGAILAVPTFALTRSREPQESEAKDKNEENKQIKT